jgi:hypothetical protein
MLTQPPPLAVRLDPAASNEVSDDLSGHAHRQVIGYLGLALPILLVQAERLRPNAPSDAWAGSSISAYYWTGGVSLFVGLLAALSLFLLTYRGYANAAGRYDRAAALVAGSAAAVVSLFPTTPPAGLASRLPWWRDWMGTTHAVAATILFATFALFTLWLFRLGTPSDTPTAEERRRDAIFLVCGIGILASMAWAATSRWSGRSIFWPESSALGFFAWSWLVKGRALRSVKSTVGAAAAKVTKAPEGRSRIHE